MKTEKDGSINETYHTGNHPVDPRLDDRTDAQVLKDLENLAFNSE